ncbi:hypothetical protein CEXT_347541 [Caerostris extrusa]|uniref:Uncharacterized protein n=1 Tax=Caerostris extrusa TaxID=172846 RepID=A0AAV4UWD1_CAEEX|nr:hypothetical protein CEXT_347541 [Caerostris extrusa]
MAGEYHLRLINFGISDGDAPENSIIYVRKGLHSPIEACISDYEAHQIQDLMAELMQHVNEADETWTRMRRNNLSSIN